MKATELRIGNWVDEYSQPVQITSLAITEPWYLGITYTESGSGATHGNHLDPIPLTEEWLLKFGFERRGSTWSKDFFLIYSAHLIINFENDWAENITIKLQYVHQLQNLYFALTGEELIIK